MVIPIIIIPNLKDKIKYLIGSIIVFFIFTLPISIHYYDFFSWIISLSIHTGNYGSGNATIIEPSMFFNNIIILLSDNFIFTIIFFFSIIFILFCQIIPKYRKYFYISHKFRVLVGLTIAQLIQLLIVSKHFSHFYMMPALMLTGTLMIFLVLNIQNIFKINIKRYALILFISICLIFYAAFVLTEINSYLSFLNKYRIECESIDNLLESKYASYTKVYYFRSSTKMYALKLGDDLAGLEYGKLLNELYPNNYFYNIWDKKYYDFQENQLATDQLTKRLNLLIEGTPFVERYLYDIYKPKLLLEDVFNGYNETIYLVKH